MTSREDYISEYLADHGSEIWWPNLIATIFLQSEYYRRLAEDYSTTSIISKYRERPEMVLPVRSLPRARLELLSEEHAQLFAGQGVRQVSVERFAAPETVKKIEAAFGLIAIVPSLFDVLSRLIKSIHLIHAEPGFDVSFTDPELPFTIFISVPLDHKFAELRLAESIVHEAMHLQLAIVEKEVSLIDDSVAKFYSPWKKMLRPTSGIIHALYVFTAIKQWLNLVKVTPSAQDYAEVRCSEIRDELALLDCELCFNALTDNGKLLFDNMLSSLRG